MYLFVKEILLKFDQIKNIDDKENIFSIINLLLFVDRKKLQGYY